MKQLTIPDLCPALIFAARQQGKLAQNHAIENRGERLTSLSRVMPPLSVQFREYFPVVNQLFEYLRPGLTSPPTRPTIKGNGQPAESSGRDSRDGVGADHPWSARRRRTEPFLEISFLSFILSALEGLRSPSRRKV